MKTVYFIRHGESESNIGGVRRGDATPLTSKGKEQATVIACRAAKLPFDILISSTMERAKDTAVAIATQTGKPIEYSPLFSERRWPSWFYGRSINDPEVVAADKELVTHFTDANFRLADEENAPDLIERAIRALAHLSERSEENIVVVTHGLFLRVVLSAVLFGDALTPVQCDAFVRGMVTANTGITVIKEDAKGRLGWKLHVFNDHAHLAD